ncbi:NADPH-dependent FMN reductase [Apilactobacillus ozensis]|uniref:NADPH-dependent FMN reductase n=1 Tax=Apilactobacillus ozensis TaxID=866801 RepID=UPI00200AB68F|nr:NAD(P)H-dependent oxidoreductase [Apilactobacillus ozensis]MCK8607177.1 NAD(P)H-dependent oxidoreductase [Apilactobacillus ozensis]
MTKINIILGSSRQNSLGQNVIKFLEKNVSAYENLTGAQFNFIKLQDYQLPFFYESIPPMANKNRQLPDNEQKWVNDMEDADGYIFLTPEYNHSFPAILKNALDYLSNQISGKAAFIISYSNNMRAGQFGGLELSTVLSKLGAFVMPSTEMMSIRNVQDTFEANGELISGSASADYYSKKLTTTISKSVFYSELFQNNKFKN